LNHLVELIVPPCTRFRQSPALMVEIRVIAARGGSRRAIRDVCVAAIGRKQARRLPA